MTFGSPEQQYVLVNTSMNIEYLVFTCIILRTTSTVLVQILNGLFEN